MVFIVGKKCNTHRFPFLSMDIKMSISPWRVWKSFHEMNAKLSMTGGRAIYSDYCLLPGRKKRSLCCLMKHNTTQKENAKTDHF